METQKEIVESLKKAKNVLVTVSNNPSVDQLSACIALSLLLTKQDVHAAAVYSGSTPSTIEFLNPSETFETTTDSLRDFIISLDKSKADKLRYKVEDNVVRIFITPYRTSITDKDLNFSQGDFNVDVVVALGVHQQEDLDQAISAHGRILHDATVVTINDAQGTDMGAINWLDESASSLCEMVTHIAEGIAKDAIDEQIATALLTGVVAETDRFSNEKTSAETMKVSALLMGAGANQHLVATKLEEPEVQPEEPQPTETDAEQNQEEPADEDALPEAAINEDGMLEITHAKERFQSDPAPQEDPAPESDDTTANPVAGDVVAPTEGEKNYPLIGRARVIGRSENYDSESDTTDRPTMTPQINSFSHGGAEEDFVSPMTLPPLRTETPPILKHDQSGYMAEEKSPETNVDSPEEERPAIESVTQKSDPEPAPTPEETVEKKPASVEAVSAPESAPAPRPEPTVAADPQPYTLPSEPNSVLPVRGDTLADLERKVASAHALRGDGPVFSPATFSNPTPQQSTPQPVDSPFRDTHMPNMVAPRTVGSDTPPKTAEQMIAMPVPSVPAPAMAQAAASHAPSAPPVPPPIMPPFQS